jgi:phosphoribosyl 1,2-cyclic phosphodiesterase
MLYGGNTSCIEVSDGNNRLILDAGTGLRGLGQDVMRSSETSGVLLFTHTHWDHICGFPFFTPFYTPGREFRVLAGHLYDKGGIQSVLASQMATPTFPVPLAALRANMHYEDFRAGDSLTGLFPGLVAKTGPINHPDGATGYRLEWHGKVVCYITDTEHFPGRRDPAVLSLIYTDEEFPDKVGWGHSTWQEGVRLSLAADVRQLAIFHHNPDHTDPIMADIEAQAKAVWAGCVVARDEMVITL